MADLRINCYVHYGRRVLLARMLRVSSVRLIDRCLCLCPLGTDLNAYLTLGILNISALVFCLLLHASRKSIRTHAINAVYTPSSTDPRLLSCRHRLNKAKVFFKCRLKKIFIAVDLSNKDSFRPSEFYSINVLVHKKGTRIVTRTESNYSFITI